MPASTRGYARYYDSPDGVDLMTKTIVTSRYGAITGLILGTYDVLMYSHAIHFGHMMSRYLLHVLPLAGMGATFSIVAYVVQQNRKKNDCFNYFIGGLACGPLLSTYLGSKHAIVAGGLALGVIAMIKKSAIDNNFTMFPDVASHMGSITGWRHDFTLVPDPKFKDSSKICGKDDADKNAENNMNNENNEETKT